jgi:hypothetical protein
MLRPQQNKKGRASKRRSKKREKKEKAREYKFLSA